MSELHGDFDNWIAQNEETSQMVFSLYLVREF